MLTIVEIVDALESGKMVVGTEVKTGTPIKVVLGNTIRDWECGEGANFIAYSINADGTYEWEDTADKYEDDFQTCGWFDMPEYYVWESVENAPNLVSLGFALHTNPACDEVWDSIGHWDAQQSKMGLPR